MKSISNKILLLFLLTNFVNAQTGNVAVVKQYKIYQIKKSVLKPGNSELSNGDETTYKLVYESNENAANKVNILIKLAEKSVFVDGSIFNTYLNSETTLSSNYDNLKKIETETSPKGTKAILYEGTHSNKKCKLQFFIPKDKGLKVLQISESGKNGNYYVEYYYFLLGE